MLATIYIHFYSSDCESVQTTFTGSTAHLAGQNGILLAGAAVQEITTVGAENERPYGSHNREIWEVERMSNSRIAL